MNSEGKRGPSGGGEGKASQGPAQGMSQGLGRKGAALPRVTTGGEG